MTYGQDGTSPYLDTFVGSTYRTRLRSNGTFSFNGVINSASDVNAGQDCVVTRDVAVGQKYRFGIGSSSVYLYYDGSNIRATKNNGASSVVIV